jgi:hypothetical protein
VSRNGCVPASPASLMTMCLEQHMDADVDLVGFDSMTAELHTPAGMLPGWSGLWSCLCIVLP